jgi:hypothetical protein
MALMYDESSAVLPVVTGRFSALTMPEVTVELRPSGAPIATTGSPTRKVRDRPRDAGLRSSAPATWRTARS